MASAQRRHPPAHVDPADRVLVDFVAPGLATWGCPECRGEHTLAIPEVGPGRPLQWRQRPCDKRVVLLVQR